MNKLVARLIAYVFVAGFCVIGPLLLLVAFDSVMQRVELVRSGLSAQGTVVAKRSTASTRAVYAPVFQFTASDGHTYIVSSDVYGLGSAFRDGQHVRVLYQQAHPESARIDAFAQLWAIPLVFGVVGGSFSLIPMLLLASWIRRRRTSGGQPRNTYPA